MTISEKPQVFISYAHEDLKTVEKLYDDLHRREVNLWFDKVNLKMGERWKLAIGKAIPKSRYFLFCISKAALRKTRDGSGFIDDELQKAYEIAIAQDERNFTIVPVRLEDVESSDNRVSVYQRHDLINNWEEAIDELAVYLGGVAIGAQINRDAMSEREQYIEGLRWKGLAYFYARDYEKSLQVFEHILEDHDAYNAKAWRGYGASLRGLGRNEEGLNAYEKALELDPTDSMTWTNKGNTLSRLGKNNLALKAYDKAISLSPNYLSAWERKGDLFLFVLNKYQEAIEAYDTALQIDTQNISCLLSKAKALVLLKQWNDAEIVLDRIALVNPLELESLLIRGLILLKKERYNDATKVYQSIIEIDAERSEAWEGKGIALISIDRAAARSTLMRAIELDTENKLVKARFALLKLDHADNMEVSLAKREYEALVKQKVVERGSRYH